MNKFSHSVSANLEFALLPATLTKIDGYEEIPPHEGRSSKNTHPSVTVRNENSVHGNGRPYHVKILMIEL